MIIEDFGSVGGGWSFVQYWECDRLCRTSFIGKPKTSTKYVNTANGVVVRNIASPSGANTGTLTNNTQVTVHSTLAGWSYVTSGSIKGYVVNAFLSTTKPLNEVRGGLAPKVGLKLTYYPTFTDKSQKKYTVAKEFDGGDKEYISLNYKYSMTGGYAIKITVVLCWVYMNQTGFYLNLHTQ